MKIFIDTNVFYSDLFMQNADFKYLFHFLNNEGNSLLLSNLVVQESENIRNRELKESLDEIKRNIKKAQKRNKNKLIFDEEGLGIDNYDLASLIKTRTEYVEEISYDDVLHSEVVGRALLKKKPFLEGEKGYRDTLIWLSFLSYLVKNDVKEDVIFISENKKDFFKKGDNLIQFHPDLAGDITQKEVKAVITPYASLFSFVNSVIDKDKHEIDRQKLEEISEDFIERSAAQFMEGMTNTDLCHYFESSIFETKVKVIRSIRAEIFEGLEDPVVMHTERLDGNDIYVAYSYNLRRVIIEIDIPIIDYTLNKDELHEIFYDVAIGQDTATLTCFVRPYFDVSFIYNDKHEELKNYEVANLWLSR